MASLVDVTKIKKAIDKKQKTINMASRKMKSAPKYVKIGWDNKSGSYPEQNGKSVEYIAKIHEFGNAIIPAKHMTLNTKHMHQKEWVDMFRKATYKKWKKGKPIDFQKILEDLGEEVKKDLRNYLYQINLIDTHRLANSIIIRYKRRK